MTIQLLQGDCREVLKSLASESVDCCVTSPPYWGLRSYLPDGHPNKPKEIGSEPTLQEWVQTMVEVFREVRRVLKPEGTLWLNLGDAYASNAGGYSETGSRGATSMPSISAGTMAAVQKGPRVPPHGLKPKDLMGQPWRVAFALQADGWWLRQEIIWHKPNPMPESARDRCTKAHEQIFLLSKSEQYFYDFDAMQEPVNGGAHARRSIEYSGAKRPGFGHGYDAVPKPRYKTPDGWDTTRGDGGHGSFHKEGREKGKVAAVGRRVGPPGNPAEASVVPKNNESMDAALAEVRSTRNTRSVWTIPTHPFKGSHFATFPPALAERCITGGCPAGGTVLDPFGGSGTVGLVADRQHKHAVLIDLDERNLPMAAERIGGDAPLFADIQTEAAWA